MFETESQSYYEILDVKPDASQSEIRQAYLRTKSAYSKDSAALYSIFDESETRRVLDSIEQAYLVLSSPEKRKEYDRVHGFLSDDRLPTTRKTPGGSHTFSFARPSESGDVAQQAAQNVFGGGGHVPEFNAPTTGDAAATASATTTTQAQASSRADSHEDYSTPRTLASHNAAGPPVQDYSSSKTAANTHENRLGIIRRIDLVKPYERNATLEQEIIDEAQFRGEFFRRIREYKGISVEEMSDFTKISKTYLNCIESEEFESLPAPAYLRGFILQIAKALKLPHEKAANAYMQNYKNAVLK